MNNESNLNHCNTINYLQEEEKMPQYTEYKYAFDPKTNMESKITKPDKTLIEALEVHLNYKCHLYCIETQNCKKKV